MKKAKALLSAMLAAIFLMSLFGCSQIRGGGNAAPPEQTGDTDFEIKSVSDSIDRDNMFTSRDISAEYDKKPVEIALRKSTAECESKFVSVDKSVVTISNDGTYIISGTLDNGQIRIDAGDSDKIQLVLSNAHINCNTSAAIYVKSAKKVFVTLADNSSNTLSNKGEFIAVDENNVDGVIYSKDNLTINGKGALTVNAPYGNGVVCNDDLVLAGGKCTITSNEKHAVKAHDSIRIADGEYFLTSKKDGLHCENDKDNKKGYIYMKGGSLTFSSDDDGVHASYYFVMDGGSIDVKKSYEGLEAQKIDINGGKINVVATDDGINAASSKDTKSTDKAVPDNPMKADESCYVKIRGASTTINASGDGIDSNGYFEVTGGEVIVFGPTDSGNAALDYSASAKISGGTLVAFGMNGMAQNFGSFSTQCSIMVTFESTTSGEVVLKDKKGNAVFTQASQKEYNNVVISTPEIKLGEKYTVCAGDEAKEVEMQSIIYGKSDMHLPDFKGKPDGEMPPAPNGEFPQPPEMPQGEQGERPEMPNGDFEPPEIPQGEAPPQPPQQNANN